MSATPAFLPIWSAAKPGESMFEFEVPFPDLDLDANSERWVLGDEVDTDDEDDPPAKRRNKGHTRTTPNYAESLIQRHLRDGFYDDARRGELRFRSRYRVPRVVYDDWKSAILEVAPEVDKLANPGLKRTDNVVPLDNKLLTVLRSLGRGVSTADDTDHSGMSPASISNSVKEICKITSTRLFDKYVYPPRDEMEMASTMQLYTDVGLAGCFGSMDAVHLPWDRCPDGLATIFRGRYGLPTLTHNCTVSNDLFFMSATHSAPGTRNDKLLVRSDPLSLALKNGRFANVSYELIGPDGAVRRLCDPYLIVDGGYHRWRHLICGYGRSFDDKEAAFTKRLTSVRKDVECAFGILKRRFRILKIPLQFQKAVTIDAVFRTCLVLHNLTLVADGRRYVGHSRASGLREWTDAGVEWGQHSSAAGACVLRRFNGRPAQVYELGPGSDPTYVDAHTAAVSAMTDHGHDPTEVGPGFEDRRSALMEHYWWVKHHQ